MRRAGDGVGSGVVRVLSQSYLSWLNEAVWALPTCWSAATRCSGAAGRDGPATAQPATARDQAAARGTLA